MRSLLEDVSYAAARVKNGIVYFFDKEGIYRKVSIDEAKEMDIEGVCVFGAYSLERFAMYIKKHSYFNDGNLIKKAICKLNPGDNFEKFEQYLQTVKLEHKDKPKGLDRFITKIEKPYFIREPENTKTNTFDYINIDVNIVSEWEEERKAYIEKHREEIWQRVITKLKESKKFQNYGIPVSFLKARVTLTKSSVLRFTFELKK